MTIILTNKLTQTSRITIRRIIWISYSGFCAALLSLAGTFLYLNPQVPRAETYRNVQLETPLRIYSEDGALLAEFGERRLIPIPLKDVPPQFINALLDTEDKRFYEHSGIDFISLANDLVGLVGSLITEGSLGPGASTITMQLARNVSFSLERRFLRKFKEMLLALKIEQELTKDEILELYINVVPFGKRAYGAQAAALTYYGKSLKDLSVPQLAMLAGIPQAPSAANPINGPVRAIARRNVVLSRMLAQGSLTRSEFNNAIVQPITARVFARELDVASPYVGEWVRQQTFDLLPDLYTGGYEIFTTINSRLQAEAIRALRRGLISYDRRHGYRGAESRLPQGALDDLEEYKENLILTYVQANGAVTTEPAVQSDGLPFALRDEVLNFLNQVPVFGGLEAAVAMTITDHWLIALRTDGTYIPLFFEDAGWARPYIEVDRRGPAPRRFSEIVSTGDVIRINTASGKPVLAQLPEIQGALVSLSPIDGEVKALTGGFDFHLNQYNHALQAARQPGSGFKPFVYSAALAAGVTPADLFMDAPLVFDDANLESQYRPDNDNNKYNGPTRLREALYRSINLVSMRVLLKVSAGHVLKHASQMGFDISNFPRNTQLAIGGGTMAISPIDMARAYTTFANGGYLIEPNIVSRITNARGETISRPQHPTVCAECIDGGAKKTQAEPAEESASLVELIKLSTTQALLAQAGASTKEQEKSEQANTPSAPHPVTVNPLDLPRLPIPAQRILDERNAYVVTSMLQDVIKRGTGRRARVLRREGLAGKTGTTNDAADTWFNGFTPELTTTVWVGFSNHAPLGARAFGSNTPLPIWIDFMEDAIKNQPEITPPQPSGLVSMKIDPSTGELALPGQKNAVFELFLEEFAPKPAKSSEPISTEPGDEVKAIDLF